MAKQDKIVPARRRRERPDDSLLIRSAESLGRVIGSLQRQLDSATKRLNSSADDSVGIAPFTSTDGNGAGGAKPVKTAAVSAHTVTRAAKRTKKSAAAGQTTARAGAKKVTRKAAPARRSGSTAAKKGVRSAAARTTAKTTRRR